MNNYQVNKLEIKKERENLQKGKIKAGRKSGCH